MATYVIDVPGFQFTTLNELLKRSRYLHARIKRSEAEVVRYYADLAGVPRATGPRRVSLRVEGWPKKGRACDKDAWWKVGLDALVIAGMLLDDDGPRCDLGPVEVATGLPRRTVITLEDV